MIGTEARRAVRKAPTRVRYSGARLAATVLGACAGGALGAILLADAAATHGRSGFEAAGAAAASGAWAGWQLIGLGLGGGPWRAARRGLFAALAATAALLLAAGGARTFATMSFVRFSDAGALILDVLDNALALAEPLNRAPAAGLAIAAAGIAVALIAEALFAAWRWRPADEDAEE